jgi:hypothetical protein
MIARHCITAAGLLALAACGSSGSKAGGNGAASATSAPGGGGAPAAAVSLQPGEWEMTMEIEGMPAQVAAAMKNAKANRTCLTKEDLSNPNGQMFSGQSSGHGCTQKEFSMVGGRIHSSSLCTAPGGSQTTTFVMDGQYSPQSFDATMSITGGARGRTGKMTTHMTGRRVGDCPAGKEG